MKKWNIIMTTLVATAIFTSCSKSDITDITVADATAKATGTWKVNYYYDNSDGVSNDFDGYSFVISDDGSVTATIGGTTHNGIWVIKNSDDDPKYSTEMEFTISGDDRMDKLDGKWLIKSVSDTEMELIDDSSPEEIHFSKS